MRRSYWIVAVVAGGLASSSCITRQTPLDSNLAPGEQWSAVLTPSAGETLHGRFLFIKTDPNGVTRAVISLAGATPGRALPWHVHYGSCGQDGAILGKPIDFPPLIAGASGTLEGVAQLPLTLHAGTQYFVNVHESQTSSREIACGALVRDDGRRVADRQ